METSSTRLNKYISESGVCSRREADRYIEKGNVLINGKRAKVGDQVFRGDKVMVNGNFIEPKTKEEEIFIAFNKPVGVTSTTDVNKVGNIIDYVNHSERIFPIGRLDKDSQGLIFLTNNGDIVNKILRAGNQHEKEYIVTVDKPITDEFIDAMSSGVPILGSTTKKCFVEKESAHVFRIILVQGMNRQIRRMCEYFDFEVTRLERIRIMNVSLKGLPVGDWRELTKEELAGISKMVENSSSTEERKVSKKSKKKVVYEWDDKQAPKITDLDASVWRPDKKPTKKPFNKSSQPNKNQPKKYSHSKSAGRSSGSKSGRRGKSKPFGR